MSTHSYSVKTQWTPLTSQTASVASFESTPPVQYGTMSHLPNHRELRFSACDFIVFFVMFLNVYISRKLFFPFTEEFSAYYHVSIESFSFILSAYDIGGLFSILINCFPPLHNIKIYLILFCMMISVVILYSMLSFSYIFISVFVIRMLIGFILTVTQANIRGILSVFFQNTKVNTTNTNPKNKLRIALVMIETSWSISTLNWVVIGIIIYQFAINYIWYLMCIYALIGAMSCYCLPSITIDEILTIKRIQSRMENRQFRNVSRNDSVNLSIFKQYHLYYFFIGYLLMTLSYNSYLVTFGPWICNSFNYNTEQLGFSTIIIAISEFTSMLTTIIAQTQYKNIQILLISLIGNIIVITLFMVILKFNFYTQSQVLIWSLIALFTFFSEIVYLNLLAINLNFTPKGLENKSVLIIGICSRLGMIIGVILGPHIVKLFGYEYLIQMIGAMQMATFILICLSFWQYKKYILRLNFQFVSSY